MQNKIRKYRLEKGWSKPQLAEKIGAYPQQIYRLESKTDGFDVKWLLKLAVAFELENPFDLVSFDDEFQLDYNNVNNMPKIVTAFKNRNSLSIVPLISWLQALHYKKYLEDDNEYLLSLKEMSLNAFAVPIGNNSMEPRFMAGDIIFVDPDKQPDENDYCLLTLNGRETTILRKADETKTHTNFTNLIPDSVIYSIDKAKSPTLSKNFLFKPHYNIPFKNVLVQ